MKKYRKVILVVIDTLNVDHLGCYGYDVPREETSPFIDSLARENALFEKHYASDVPTPPSFTSLMYGTRGIHNGIVGFNNSIEEFSAKNPPLAKCYNKKGFRTGMISNLIYVSPWLKEGFQDIYTPGGEFQGGNADEVTRESLDWIEKHSKEDFFLFTHYWAPHCPYRERSKEKYRKMFSENEYEDYAPDMKYFEKNKHLNTLYKEKHAYNKDPYDPEKNLRYYDSNIRYVDECLKNIFNKLESLGIRDETLVLITSDHGEAFGEYGFWDHWSSYRNISQLPLIIVGNGIKSRNVQPYTQNVDVMPTLLDLSNLDIPKEIDGKSAVPLLKGRKKFRDKVVVNSDGTVIQRMYVKGDYALVHTLSNPIWDHIDEFELFDLSKDPRQVKDISQKKEKKTKELRLELQDWISSQLDGSPDPLELSKFRGGWMWEGFSEMLKASDWENILNAYPELKDAMEADIIIK